MANTIETMLPEVLMRKIIDGTLEDFEDNTFVDSIRERKFASHPNLERVALPNYTTFMSGVGTASGYEFQNCSKLQTVLLPKLSSFLSGWIFAGCGASATPLTIALPSLTSMSGDRIFRASYCEAVDFGEGVSRISPDTFYVTTSGKYKDVILRRKDSPVTAASTDAIIGLTTARNNTIYIPKVLYDHLGDGSAYDYQSASNWSAATRTYAQIEGSQYEHYYADGTPIVGG